MIVNMKRQCIKCYSLNFHGSSFNKIVTIVFILLLEIVLAILMELVLKLLAISIKMYEESTVCILL